MAAVDSLTLLASYLYFAALPYIGIAAVRPISVWGARKAAKFRGALRRQDVELAVIEAVPPARLVWYSTSKGTTVTLKRDQ